MRVRTLTGNRDVEWAAQLMARRREEYAAFSPVFWRPRHGVTDEHARFLGGQLDRPGLVALRTDHGFIISHPRGGESVVDDFALDGEGSWATDGRELLHSIWRMVSGHATAVRVVTAAADEPKVAMLVACELRLAEQWWVTPLQPTLEASESPSRVTGTCFPGLLGPAPPLYDPGGPVLLADRVDATAALTTLEEEAAGMGAVMIVLPTQAGAQRETQLRSLGWTVASQWYLGKPR